MLLGANTTEVVSTLRLVLPDPNAGIVDWVRAMVVVGGLMLITDPEHTVATMAGAGSLGVDCIGTFTTFTGDITGEGVPEGKAASLTKESSLVSLPPSLVCSCLI